MIICVHCQCQPDLLKVDWAYGATMRTRTKVVIMVPMDSIFGMTQYYKHTQRRVNTNEYNGYTFSCKALSSESYQTQPSTKKTQVTQPNKYPISGLKCNIALKMIWKRFGMKSIQSINTNMDISIHPARCLLFVVLDILLPRILKILFSFCFHNYPS